MTTLDLLCALLKAALNAEADESGSPRVSLPPLPPFDWRSLYALADSHRVTELMAFALRGHAEYEAQGGAFERAAGNAVILESVIHFETLALYDELERAGVDFCPLKGIVVKSLYPLPWLRSMQDVDLLVHPGQARAAVEAAEACGYVYRRYASVHHVLSDARELYDLELHERLLSDWSRHVEVNDRVWDAAKPIAPGRFRRALPPDQQYLYHIVHADKHISRGEAVPIRTLVDLYLMDRAYGGELGKADAELAALGLKTFADDLAAISRAWFASGAMNRRQKRLIAYMINSADAGNAQQAAYNRERLFWTYRRVQNGDLSIRRMLFPGREWLIGRYPVLAKKPALLPLYRLLRVPESAYRLIAHYAKIAWLRLRGAVPPDYAGRE